MAQMDLSTLYNRALEARGRQQQIQQRGQAFQQDMQAAQLQQREAEMGQAAREAQFFVSAMGEVGEDPEALQQGWSMARQALARAGGDVNGLSDVFNPQQFRQIQGLAQLSSTAQGQDTIQSTFVNDKGQRVALYRSGRTVELGGAFNRPITIQVGGREMLLDPATRQVTDPATGQVLGNVSGMPEADQPQAGGQQPAQPIDRSQIAQEEAEMEADRARMVEEARVTGRAEAEQRISEPQRIQAAEMQLSKFDGLIGTIDRAISSVGPSTAGFMGTQLSAIPGTEARDLMRTVQTIQANLGFDTLQAMREASPTGGALGSVSERELSLLTAAVNSLEQDQSPEQLRQNLMRIREHYNNWRESVRQSISPDGQSQPAPAAPSPSGLPSAQQSRLEELRAKRDRGEL